MKIAVASSGLGHIVRGIETWAHDTACALHNQGIDVTLFAARNIENIAVNVVIVPCLERNHPLNIAITHIAPKWTWRWNLKSTYALEQWSFWRKLQKQLNKGGYDILHVQDPIIAILAQRAYAKGRINCRCILAHGTEEPVDFLAGLPFVQHLAPWHLQQMLQSIKKTNPPLTDDDLAGWVAIPNFVDTSRFSPLADLKEKNKIRAKMCLPENATIWGTAAAIKKHHKRIDWLIEEFAFAAEQQPNLHLAIAGSRQKDTDTLRALAQTRCPGKVTFLENFPHENMPAFYQALDAFVLTSLFEMMPIAILEALSSGLPVFCHDHPILQWMTGPGGERIKMDKKGQLAECMQQIGRDQLMDKGKQAREHACKSFAMPHVIQAYIDYYRNIIALP